MSSTLIDTIIFAVILGFAIWGIFKGFIRQLVSIVALFLGIWCAVKFSTILALKLTEWFSLTIELKSLKIITFVIIFLGVLIISNFIGKGIESIIKLSMLDWLNRLLGFVFAAIKITIILCILAGFVNYLNTQFKFFPDEILTQSKGYIFLNKFANTLFPYLRGIFGN